MNITKEQLTKLLDFVETYAGVSPEHECATILRGLSDAEPQNRCITELLAFAKDHPGTYIFPSWDGSRVMKYLATSPQAAQTAVKSESLAQAAQAPARLPSEGKTIEALAPTEAALREVVRLSEDAGLYDDFQTEAQERPAYPEGDVVGLCVCGSWSGGRCLRCEWRAGSKP